MARGRGVGEKICPRCGKRYSYIERSEREHNVYLYAVHYSYEVRDGKRVRVKKRCYLGPESEYKYVTRLHIDVVDSEGLVLEGARSTDRAVRYIEALTEYFRRKGKSGLTDEELIALRKLVYTLLDILGENPHL